MDPPNKRRRLAPKLPDPVPPPPGHPPILPARAGSEQTASANPPNGSGLERAASPAQPQRHDFETFAKHLQDAAMYIYRQGQRPPYADVSALLLKWDDDVTASAEVSSLERVLHDRYNFHTERWGIPAVANPSAKLSAHIADFLNQAGADHLLIIYYVGYGFVGLDNKLYWACNARDDSPKLKWDGVRCLFDDAQSDVLVLLDSCASKDTPVAGSHGAKQIIAACAPESSPREPGYRTFTSYLVEALDGLGNGRPFNVERLYDEILACQQHDVHAPLEHDQQRVHKPAHVLPQVPLFMTLTPGKDATIDLAPVPRHQRGASAAFDDKAHGIFPLGRDSPVISPAAVADMVFDEARVLVCTTFVGDVSPDMASFKQWIASTPALTSKVAVEGMFLGPPTVLLISIPQSLWSIIEQDKICFSLGYINSRNLIHLYDGLMKAATAPAPCTSLYPSAEDVEDGRTLLAARQAAVSNHTPSHSADHSHAAYYAQPASLPLPPLPSPQPSLPPLSRAQPPQQQLQQQHHLPPPSYHSVGSPTRYQRQEIPPLQQQQQQLQQQAQQHGEFSSPPHLPRIRSRGDSPVLKEESEDSAEMKEAAEQLKALSHIRPSNGMGSSGLLMPTASSRLSKIARDAIKDVIKCKSDNSETEDSDATNVDEGGGAFGKKAKARRDYRFKMSKSQDGHSPSRPRSQSDRPAAALATLQPQGGVASESQCGFCDHEPFKDASSLRKHIAAAHTRPFPCAYAFAGCTSTFGSKNEWKRHIASQHLCLQYYRCSGCSQNATDGKGNEFNRKDLFTQHLRRMHAPVYIRKAVQKRDGKVETEWEDYVKEMQKTCCIVRRRPPQRAACPKPGCVRPFEGRNAWDDWTEHVGRHMENGEGELLEVDDLLIAWSLEEGIIVRTDSGSYRLCNPMGNVGNNGGLIGTRRSSHSISISDGIKAATAAFSPDAAAAHKPMMPPTPPPTTTRHVNEEAEHGHHERSESHPSNGLPDKVERMELSERKEEERGHGNGSGNGNGNSNSNGNSHNHDKEVKMGSEAFHSITVATALAAAAMEKKKMAGSAMEVDG